MKIRTFVLGVLLLLAPGLARAEECASMAYLTRAAQAQKNTKKLEVTDPAGVRSLVNKIIQKYGLPDGLDPATFDGALSVIGPVSGVIYFGVGDTTCRWIVGPASHLQELLDAAAVNGSI